MRDVLTAIAVLLAPIAWAALCLAGSDVAWQAVKPGVLCGVVAWVAWLPNRERMDAPLWGQPLDALLAMPVMGGGWAGAFLWPPVAVWWL